jgi:hypothetical protein
MEHTTTERLPFVRIVENGRRAVLEIPSNSAGELATEGALLGLVRERGVAVDAGVEQRVRALAARHRGRAEGDFSDVEGVVAEWTAPVHGEPARIEWCAGFEPAEQLAAEAETGPCSAADGVDHYNRVRRIKVAAGEVVGRVVPPGEGTDGRDVCGRSVPANRGRKLALQPDESVQVEADGSIRALKEGVLSLAALPVNFDAIRMQASEEHANTVFDHHYGRLYDRYRAQNTLVQQAGVLSPLLAVRSLSMALAASDVEQHRHFATAAEAYRRGLIKWSNDYLRDNTRTGEWDWKAPPEVWRQYPPFTYAIPAPAALLAHQRTALLVLGGWLAVTLLLLVRTPAPAVA